MDEASRAGIAAALGDDVASPPPSGDIAAMTEAVSAAGLVIVTGAFGATEEPCAASLLPACVAALDARPIMVFGAALRAGIPEQDLAVLRAVLNSASAVTLRDEASARVAKDSFGLSFPLQVSTDPAFALRAAPPERSRAFLNGLGALDHGPLVGVALGPGRPLGAWETILPAALDDFLSRRGGRVLFMVIGEEARPDLEHALAGRLQRAMTMWRSSLIGDVRRAPADLAALVGSLDLLLASSRFGVTLAALAGTPCVALDTDTSLASLQAALGVPDLLASSSAGHEALTIAFDRALDDRESLTGAMRRGVARMSELVARDAETALAHVEPSDAAVPAVRTEKVQALLTAFAGGRSDTREAPGHGSPGFAGGAALVDLEERMVRQSGELRDWKARAEEAQSDATNARRELEAIYDSRFWKWAVAFRTVRRSADDTAVLWRRRLPRRLRRLSAAQEAAVRAAVPGTEDAVLERQAWPPGVSLAPLLERIARSRGAVVFPPSVGWAIPLAQRPHHLARAFAQMGYVAVYDTTNGTDEVEGLREIEPNLFLFRGPHDRLHELPQPLVWTVSYNAHFRDRYPAGCTSVYDWIDDLSVFVHPRHEVEATHRRALERATVVACVARQLQDEARTSRPDALYLPNGVEYDRFADPDLVPADDPVLARFRGDKKPILGYYGALAAWFDYKLLEVVSRQRPDWNFLLIGPNYDGSLVGEALFNRPNVLWTGTRPYDQLPRYLRLFDVACIPFQINEITRATSPLKLYEYFAGGKPVLTTAMPECMAYEEVRIAHDPGEFSKLLDEARRDGGDAAFTARQRALGHANSWKARVEEVMAHVTAQAGARKSGARSDTARS